MRIFPVASITFLAGFFLPTAVNAQCVECAQQMYQATLVSNSWSAFNDVRRNDDYRRDADNNICYSANRSWSNCRNRADLKTNAVKSNLSVSIANQTESAVMAILNPEFRRRVTANGPANANQWLNKAAGDVGRQVGALAPEYRRRAATNDGAATQWYLANARQIATNYVSGRTANIVANASGIPADTLKQIENAAFSVIEPTINQRAQSRGRAATVEWARSVGVAVGTGVRNLAPEYVQRSKAIGRADADAWIIGQSRQLAQNQVRYAK